jgi:hypothetical protein
VISINTVENIWPDGLPKPYMHLAEVISFEIQNGLGSAYQLLRRLLKND